MKRLHRRTSIVLDQTNCEAKARPKSNIQNFPKGPETQNKAFARECYTNSQGHSELQPLRLQNISISRVFKNAAFAREGYHKLIDKAMQSEGGDMKRAIFFRTALNQECTVCLVGVHKNQWKPTQRESPESLKS